MCCHPSSEKKKKRTAELVLGQLIDCFQSCFQIPFYSSFSIHANLLLHAKAVGMATLSLATIVCTNGQARIAATADFLLAVVLGSQFTQCGFNHTTTKT